MTFDLPGEKLFLGRSKVIRGIIVQKEGEPGDEAAIILFCHLPGC